MAILAICAGILLLLIVLWDTFETVVLPRTVTRRLRLTRLFYLMMWGIWSWVARLTRPDRRDAILSDYGPLSLLMLMVCWAACLIVSFGLIRWGLAFRYYSAATPPGFVTQLFRSGATFVTLGLGDDIAHLYLARFVAVAEAGTGLGFLAIVIGYLPVLYQAFSRREVGISLLDARAGSPPTAGELLRRHGKARQMEALFSLLQEWERWSSDVLESHLSFPILCFYRSQHDRESWLSALTAILDTCTLIRIGFEGSEPWQARLAWQAQMTFAMARHAAIDLALILKTSPKPPTSDRLPPDVFEALYARLDRAGLPLCRSESDQAQLAEMRREYEPYVYAMAERLLLSLPPWLMTEDRADNWQTSAWNHAEHFNA